MMRTPDRWAVAVRTPSGDIHTERHAVAPPSAKAFLRGPATIVQSLRIGMHALRVVLRETTGIEPAMQQLATTAGAGGVAILAIFVVAPGVLIGGVRGVTGAAIEAGARAGMLLVYLAAVRRAPQTRRLFRYHGAEHKTIAAFERHGAMPSHADASVLSPVHGRCGSTFIALFVIVCGIVFAFVPRTPLWSGALIRVALVPLVVALCYEAMRAAARDHDALWARAVTLPGRLLQRVTTAEPHHDELDVALAALATLLR